MKLSLLLLAIGATWAQRPDAAGTWKLDLAQSKQVEGKPLTLYRDFLLTIGTDGGKLMWKEKLTHDRGVVGESMNTFATDYKVHPFVRTSDGKPQESMQIRARWIGSELYWMVWNSVASVQRRIRWSADGKTMTADVELIGANSHVTAREIWRRQ